MSDSPRAQLVNRGWNLILTHWTTHCGTREKGWLHHLLLSNSKPTQLCGVRLVSLI